MQEKNPWTKIDSQILYQNPWLTLREDHVIRPDGNKGIYTVVEARIATGVLALTKDHQLYLVGQYRYPLDTYSWEIIEGGAEPNESPLETAKRELNEEAGLQAKQWQQLGGEIHLSNCISSECGYLFVATDLTEGPPKPDPDEILTIKKVPFTQALNMVHQNEIKDAMSIMGILQLEQLLQNRDQA